MIQTLSDSCCGQNGMKAIVVSTYQISIDLLSKVNYLRFQTCAFVPIQKQLESVYKIGLNKIRTAISMMKPR